MQEAFCFRGGSRTAATCKMGLFVIIVKKPLTIITKSSILDVVAVLDPPLYIEFAIQKPLYLY